MRLDWQANIQHTFPVTINVDAYDRAGLLHDITGVFFKQQTNVIAMNSLSDKQKNRVALTMIMEVTSLNELLHTLEKIEQLPNVNPVFLNHNLLNHVLIEFNNATTMCVYNTANYLVNVGECTS